MKGRQWPRGSQPLLFSGIAQEVSECPGQVALQSHLTGRACASCFVRLSNSQTLQGLRPDSMSGAWLHRQLHSPLTDGAQRS